MKRSDLHAFIMRVNYFPWVAAAGSVKHGVVRFGIIKGKKDDIEMLTFAEIRARRDAGLAQHEQANAARAGNW